MYVSMEAVGALERIAMWTHLPAPQRSRLVADDFDDGQVGDHAGQAPFNVQQMSGPRAA